MLRIIVRLLIILILTNNVNAEQATSGNLLPNAGTGTTSLQNQSGSVDGINGSTGWTTTGTTTFNNEIEANGTGTVSATGSLENITTTKSDGSSFTTTTDSLDGGVRLNSTTEVQNCEWSGSAYQCGQATNGRDSYSTTVNILDGNNNSLATVTQNRNNDAGYYGNTYTYTDTVIHNGTGARNWSWSWTGIDGNDINSTSPVAPNLLGAELTATLLDINYSPLPPAKQEPNFDNEKMVKSFATFKNWYLQQTGLEIVKTEALILSRKHFYTGTFDALFKNSKGELIIYDWKTSSGIRDSHIIQCYLYALALEEQFNTKVPRGVIVNSTREGKLNIKTFEIGQEQHEIALACLKLFFFLNPNKGRQNVI